MKITKLFKSKKGNSPRLTAENATRNLSKVEIDQVSGGVGKRSKNIRK